MPTNKETTTRRKTTTSKKPSTKKEEVVVEEVKDKNEDIIKSLQEQIELLTKTVLQQQQQINEKPKVEEVKDETEFVNPFKAIEIVHMGFGRGTMKEQQVTYGFNGFGHKYKLRFEHLQILLQNTRFRRMFEDIKFKILDDEAIDELGLRPYYDKFDVDIDYFDEVIKDQPNNVSSKISKLNKYQKKSFLLYFINEGAKNNPLALDRNMQYALGSLYPNIDFNSCIQTQSELNKYFNKL